MMYLIKADEILKWIGTQDWIPVLTLLAVTVALFQERIARFFRRSKLDVVLSLQAPDSHIIQMRDRNSGMIAGDAFYLRLRISNCKGSTAKDVEVLAVNLWKHADDGSKKVVEEFLPMNLVWSHFEPRTFMTDVPRGLFRHCDFGRLQKVGATTMLILDTIAQPNPTENGKYPNVLERGKYEFELWVSGENTRVTKKKWRLEFDGELLSSGEAMRREHIKLEEI